MQAAGAVGELVSGILTAMAVVPSASVRSRAAAKRVGRWGLLLAVCASVVLAACGGSDEDTQQTNGGQTAPAENTASRTPDPAPSVQLTSVDRQVWTPGPPDRSRIPVLLYHGIAPVSDFANSADAVFGLDPPEFAKQMVLLDTAGYETITLEEFARFVAGEDVELPPHPLLLTFDDARADSWTGGDTILKELGFNAVMFVDVGRVEDGDPEYLTWEELETAEQSGRWDLQLHAGHGHQMIRFGPRADDYGPFYAYRKEGETFAEWRERVLGDIEWGQETLAANIPSYRPLAFAPPFGHFGQEGTNDPRIAEVLLPWLVERFGLVFTQDRSIFATPGQRQPVGRLQVTRDLSGGELHEWLVGERTQ
jgi:peptidoglycan/xylan/chitin deacetylase (PgdA/CDA1 family)